MKQYFAGLLLVLIAISCNTKKEEAVSEEAAYISRPVGENKNGAYTVIETDSLKYKWGVDLKEKLHLAEMAKITDIRIVETVTAGDAEETCYLLLANMPDNSAVIGSVLYQKDNKFYFEITQKTKQESAQVIICKGSCASTNCTPVVLLHGNKKNLICSPDSNSEKIVSEIY